MLYVAASLHACLVQVLSEEPWPTESCFLQPRKVCGSDQFYFRVVHIGIVIKHSILN
jgi:hypothetical protein